MLWTPQCRLNKNVIVMSNAQRHASCDCFLLFWLLGDCHQLGFLTHSVPRLSYPMWQGECCKLLFTVTVCVWKRSYIYTFEMLSFSCRFPWDMPTLCYHLRSSIYLTCREALYYRMPLSLFSTSDYGWMYYNTYKTLAVPSVMPIPHPAPITSLDAFKPGSSDLSENKIS